MAPVPRTCTTPARTALDDAVGADEPRPGRRALDGGRTDDGLRQFVSGDVLLARLEQLRVGGIGALDELDDRDHLVAPALRRPSGDDDVVDAEFDRG